MANLENINVLSSILGQYSNKKLSDGTIFRCLHKAFLQDSTRVRDIYFLGICPDGEQIRIVVASSSIRRVR